MAKASVRRMTRIVEVPKSEPQTCEELVRAILNALQSKRFGTAMPIWEETQRASGGMVQSLELQAAHLLNAFSLGAYTPEELKEKAAVLKQIHEKLVMRA